MQNLHVGKFLRISAEESQDVLLWWVAERIDQGADDSELHGWRRMLMSAPGRIFVKLDNEDDRYFHSLQLREARKAEGHSTRQTALQVSCDVWSFKERKERGGAKLSAKDVAKLYDDSIVTFSSESEVRTHGLIDVCITIYKRIMRLPDLKAIALRLEELPAGSPLNSVYKIQDCVVSPKWIPSE